MYTPGAGSFSALIHLLAKYPKITLGVGLLSLTTYLGSSMGPEVHTDSAHATLRAVEQQIINEKGSLTANSQAVTAAFNEVAGSALTDQTIRYVLDNACKCDDVSVSDVRKDPELMRDVGFLLFLDLARTYELTQAKAHYTSQQP